MGQVAHAEAARRLIRAAAIPAQASLEAVLEQVHRPLVEGFGASGSWIHVLDEEGLFASRCNNAMVGLEAMTEDDSARVLELIEEHVARTGSVHGEAIVDGWETHASRFVKVMPTEYKKVLEAQKVEASRTSLRVVS